MAAVQITKFTDVAGNVIPAGDNANNAVRVNLVAGGGSGGTSSRDGEAFVAGTTLGVPIMGEDPTSGNLLVAKLSPGTRNLEVVGTFSVAPVVATDATTTQATVGTAASTVLAANAARVGLIFQNNGTTVIKIRLSSTTDPTQSIYTFALRIGGKNNDGSSQIFQPSINWTGQVRAISDAAGGLLNITELLP